MLGNGTFINQYQTNTAGVADGSTREANFGSLNTNHKTKSQPNTIGMFQRSANEIYTGGIGGTETRERSNEHIQNEVMRMMIDETSSFQ